MIFRVFVSKSET